MFQPSPWLIGSMNRPKLCRMPMESDRISPPQAMAINTLSGRDFSIGFSLSVFNRPGPAETSDEGAGPGEDQKIAPQHQRRPGGRELRPLVVLDHR